MGIGGESGGDIELPWMVRVIRTQVRTIVSVAPDMIGINCTQHWMMNSEDRRQHYNTRKINVVGALHRCPAFAIQVVISHNLPSGLRGICTLSAGAQGALYCR